MATEVSADHPHFPKGYELEIPGIGVVPNGGSLIVTDEQEEQYEARTGRKFRDDFKKSEPFTAKAAKNPSDGGGEE